MKIHWIEKFNKNKENLTKMPKSENSVLFEYILEYPSVPFPAITIFSALTMLYLGRLWNPMMPISLLHIAMGDVCTQNGGHRIEHWSWRFIPHVHVALIAESMPATWNIFI